VIVRAWFASRLWAIAASGHSLPARCSGSKRDALSRRASPSTSSMDSSLPMPCIADKAALHAAWHGVGLALLSSVTLIPRPSLLVVSVPADFGGVLVPD
jgi:hypothetical protein